MRYPVFSVLQTGTPLGVEAATIAELQVLLEGVPLPVERDGLVAYATHEGAEPRLVGLLRSLPARRYESIDEAAEELQQLQPPRAFEDAESPHEESGAPPGGSEYTNPHPESGFVREHGPA